MAYTAPFNDIHAALAEAGLQQGIDSGLYVELTPDLAEAVIGEAGKFAEARLNPLYRIGDEVGAVLKGERVTLPQGWAEAYRDWCAAGWNALPCPADFGGQNLPALINAACTEIWNGANMAFGLCPMLTVSGIDALHTHGTDELKKIYLEKLISGMWTGSMQLTEPQAGSDLAQIRMRADKQSDSTYKLFGTKIFITYGEHEMTDNIVHFILARTSDDGIKGLSLFLAPKFMVNKDGSLGARNDINAVGLEHKLGINASPTCTMTCGDHGGAVAYLVGEEGRGIQCMFTMMNSARLGVGLQGVGMAEAAMQHAMNYANERKQGKAGQDGSAPIVAHADVKRMLLEMKSKIQAARLICYMTAASLDRGKLGKDMKAAERAALLTPLAKAFSTDIANEVASLGIQVHGGMGFIEETGAAQFFRDARIAAIYEGTNGIQANDLVGRKLPMNDGAAMRDEIALIRDTAKKVSELNSQNFGRTAQRLQETADALEDASTWLLQTLKTDQQAALAGAVSYLRLASLGIGGAALARVALNSDRAQNPLPVQLARYFAEQQLSAAKGLALAIIEGGESVTATALDAA
ncbi:MAG: acyl-CoA dehydrogenase [Pseudomonadota bacterium]